MEQLIMTPRLFKEFGFTVDHVVAAAKESIAAA